MLSEVIDLIFLVFEIISFRDLPSKLQRFETTGKECLCSILRSSATGERRKELLFSITAISHRGSKS